MSAAVPARPSTSPPLLATLEMRGRPRYRPDEVRTDLAESCDPSPGLGGSRRRGSAAAFVLSGVARLSLEGCLVRGRRTWSADVRRDRRFEVGNAGVETGRRAMARQLCTGSPRSRRSRKLTSPDWLPPQEREPQTRCLSRRSSLRTSTSRLSVRPSILAQDSTVANVTVPRSCRNRA